MSDDIEVQVPDGKAATSQLDDFALLRRYVEKDDRVALEALFRRHADTAYSTAMRVCRNPSDAEDAVQAAMINVMRVAADYRGGSDIGVRVWMMKIVVGVCKERIRSEVRRRTREEKSCETQDAVYVPAEPFASDEEAAIAKAVFTALNELPEHYKLPIWLHHYQGMSLHEAATALAISDNTLHVQLNRGMKKLREVLESRRIEMPMASLVAIMPLLRGETAPQSLLAGFSEIVSGGMPAGFVPTDGAGGKVLSTWSVVRRAAAILLVFGAGTTAYLVSTNRPFVQSTPPVPKGFLHRWDFNKPGIPAEFKVMVGKPLKYLAGEGPDKSGCIEMDEGAVKIDVPITSFPFRMNFKAAVVEPYGKAVRLSTDWLPARDVGIVMGLSKPLIHEISPDQKYSKWFEGTDYYSGDWIARWRNGRFLEVVVSRPEPDGRVTLSSFAGQDYPMKMGRLVIDDVTITSIQTNELPDMSVYLQALEQIPANKRKGVVQTTIKDGRPASIKFHSYVSEKGAAVVSE
ncbi:MAG: hypothetical protein C0404_01280 [Verrucomicrobia bacterium]|nr:hypothetical protein [Verrucomicrobiota bacterium]